MHKNRSLAAVAAVLALTALAGAGYRRLAGPRVGEAGDGGGTVVATGQTVNPAGDVLTLPGSRPVDVALSPDGKTLYTKDNRGFVAVDAATWRPRGPVLAFEKGGGSLHGIALSADGRRLFATDSGDGLCEAAVGEDGAVSAWTRRIVLPGPEGKGASYPCGLALSADGKTAFVCLSRNNTLAVVDLAAGRVTREIPVGVAPFDVALTPDGRTAFVSDWGGRRPKPGEPTAPSAGTPTLIDKRGVASSGAVSVVDLAAGREERQLPAGRHASDVALSPDGRTLAVANANEDTVTLIDVPGRSVRSTVSVRPDAALPFGAMPNALCFAPDGKTLYVALGGDNAVAVVALPQGRVTGLIPAGWYPSALACDAGRVFVASVKGLGSRSPGDGEDPKTKGRNVYAYTGTLQRVALPVAAGELARHTAEARRGAEVAAALRAGGDRPRKNAPPVPVPERAGEPSVFEHVVYVIKENRTYDQVFGDIERGDGDPNLCLFGRAVTPNHHALADEFVLLDNFYCNGVLSADGHSWATEGNVTDHLEKAFGGFTRSYTFGDDPLTYSSSGFLWDAALARGKTVRNYGEMDYAEPEPKGRYADIWADWSAKGGRYRFTHKIGVENLRRHSHPDYPGWNMEIPDRIRADVFLKELAEFEKPGGRLPNLSIVYLPNDHTEGTKPGAPTPAAYLADNDLALGRIVEGISKSRFWPKTCIFVVEDDPQAGFDHVDGHRSLCLVVSPYSRRGGAVVSEFYNQTSVLHTIELMLGLPPMNRMDALAPPMRSCFTDRPDPRPYACRPVDEKTLAAVNPSRSALTGRMRRLAGASARQNFARIDAADEDTLNRILWHAAKGPDAPYPAAFAGAHGRGLKARGLLPDATEEVEEDEDDR